MRRDDGFKAMYQSDLFAILQLILPHTNMTSFAGALTPRPAFNASTPGASNSISNPNDLLYCRELVNPFSRRPRYAQCTSAMCQLPDLFSTGALSVPKISSSSQSEEISAHVRSESNSMPVPGPLQQRGQGLVTRPVRLNQQCLRTLLPCAKVAVLLTPGTKGWRPFRLMQWTIMQRPM